MRSDLLFHFKRILGLLILLGISAVFLFSAGSKLLAIEPFEWTFLELLPIGFNAASIIARLFIALEIAIALFLLGHISLRKYTYKVAFLLLILLTGYLLVVLWKQGNSGNCGCFGDAYQMTPLAAVIKNLIMMAGLAVLWFIYPGKKAIKAGKTTTTFVVSGALLASAIIPFAAAPIYLSDNGAVAHEPISLKAVYYSGKPAPSINLDSGKHIVAFLSLTCPHCHKAAYLIQMLHRSNPDLPFFMVLNGRPVNEQGFFEDTKSIGVPHALIREIEPFKKMAGEYVPAIYWINNSVIERKTYYTGLDPLEIRKWLK